MKRDISEFKALIIATSRELLAISEEASTISPAPGKWSPRQVIGHLIDSACNNHQRFVRMQFANDKFFPRYQQDDWVNVQHYQDESWEVLVNLWKYYNLHISHVIAATPENVLHEVITKYTSEQISWIPAEHKEKFTMEYLFTDYVEHMKHHLKQALKS